MSEQELSDVELTRAAMTPEQLEQTSTQELIIEQAVQAPSFLDGSGSSLTPESPVA